MPLLNPTAETGVTTPEDKFQIPYAVGLDLAVTGDTTTRGHSVTLSVDAINEEFWLWDMFGYSEKDGTSLHRVLPERSGHDGTMYPITYQQAFRIPLQPAENNGDGWPVWDIVAFKVQYVTPLYKVLEDDEVTHEHERFCVWTRRPAAQNEKIPGGTFYFADDGLPAFGGQMPLQEVGVRTGRTQELSCKWIDVPVYEQQKFSDMANKVNEEPITLDGVEYPAETVLFLTAGEEPRISPLGTPTRDINITLLIRLDGRSWNNFWKKSSADYVRVTHNGLSSGNPIFGLADLNDLWAFTP